ncbi:MAG: hypothetical protein FJY85_17960 [Deltaproteobacteria bacterium]|nr:hypothetical protein [Deltaproteobacteria bacterium]MBM4149973.1 hypothetical protein [Lentisphaerota bacterium]
MRHCYQATSNMGKVVCCVATLLVVAGCIVTKDVTEEPELRGGHAKDVSYILLSDVAVTEFGVLSTAAGTIKVARSVTTASEGLVPSGTVMRLERVVYRQHPEDGASLLPMAMIQSGQWQGREVDLRHLSRNVREAGRNPYTFYILEPDPKYLKLVTSPTSEPERNITGTEQLAP